MIATTSLVAPGTAGAAGMDISGLSPITYEEGGPPVAVAPDIEITGGGTFADGYIEFGVKDGQAEDRLFLPEGETPSTTKDAITVIGSAVYLGLGSSYKQIGTVNATNDGQNGRPLRVDFSAALENSNFDDGLNGWTVHENVVTLGALASKSQGRAVTRTGSTAPYTINGPGYSFKSDIAYGSGGSPGWAYESKEGTQSRAGSFSASVLPLLDHDTSLRLWFDTNCNQLSGSSYCSIYGPDAWSTPFEAKAGDDLAFDWSAAGGSDNYEVYGFLVKTSATPGTPEVNTHTELMYGRGNSQPWKTSTGKIPADGTYQFRFVTGSYDATGGLALGASLYIDNIRVLSSDATSAVAQAIARKVHFENTGNNPRGEINIGITAESSEGASTPAEVPVETELVDDAPVIASINKVTFTNTEGTTSYSNQTGTVPATDPEGDTITYSIVGGSEDAVTINGVDYTHSLEGTYGTIYINETTGKYVIVPNADAIEATRTGASETFTVAATAKGLTTTQDIDLDVAIAASAPSAPTDVTVSEGDGYVDLSWGEPDWLGGEITGYKIESSTDGIHWTVVTSDTGSADTNYRVDGLDNGTPTYFRVIAINGSGTGSESDEVVGTPRTVPGAPTITSIKAGNKMLTVEFVAPTDDGNATITSYEYSVDGGVTWQTRRTGTTESPLVIGPLANGTTFPVMIRAVNVAGAGAASNQIPATPLEAAVIPSTGEPAAPTGSAVLLVDGQPRSVTITRAPFGPTTPNGTLRFTDNDFSVDLFAIGENGKSLETDTQGRLVLVAGSFAEASGRGFLPGSKVDVWLMSTPILLGTVIVRADGTFSAKLPVPAGIEPGPHTIQLNGVGADSSVRTLSVGVVVRGAVKSASASRGSDSNSRGTDSGNGNNRGVGNGNKSGDHGAKASKLAFTGGYAALMSGLGLALLLVGSVVTATGRKRRQSAA